MCRNGRLWGAFSETVGANPIIVSVKLAKIRYIATMGFRLYNITVSAVNLGRSPKIDAMYALETCRLDLTDNDLVSIDLLYFIL